MADNTVKDDLVPTLAFFEIETDLLESYELAGIAVSQFRPSITYSSQQVSTVFTVGRSWKGM